MIQQFADLKNKRKQNLSKEQLKDSQKNWARHYKRALLIKHVRTKIIKHKS